MNEEYALKIPNLINIFIFFERNTFFRQEFVNEINFMRKWKN